ncbi:Phage-related minor tail protein [Virgibacillus subterraneus]|uniref:Phage-related minor tail protein n=1 Tax=Virgibacillus subterraneus TaxID=621109 RepID=A0A1H9KNG5_9BACI|nr:phage tail tape measure protein [Virgibacillus subterraneus]SER00475.1 Phage-related minor tail protein [Virgibacillus subterraneus]
MADGKISIDTRINQKGIDTGIKTMQTKLNKTGAKLKSAGMKMSAGFTAPILALGGVAFAAADDIDKAYRNIRVGTGKVGEDLDELKEQFDEVFTNVPDSADTVSNALATMNTLTGATGDVLSDLTQSTLDASRTLGEDGVANSQAFGKAMSQWQIPAKNGVDELDNLYKLTQDYGVGLGEISSHLTEYGSVLQNAGFDMGESAELMSKLEAGGLSVSRVMPGLNMAFRNWSSEGKNSRKEFEKTISKMQDAETETEALSIATEQFGAEGAQRLTTAIRNGAIPALDELGKSSGDSKGLIEETTEATLTIGEEFGILKNEAMSKLQPLGQILLDLGKDALPPLIDGITKMAEWFKNLSPTAQKVVLIVTALAAAIGPLLIFVGMMVTAFTTLMPILTAIGGALMLLLSPIPMIILGVGALVVLIIGYWDQIKAVTITVFTAIWDFLKMIWNGIKTYFITMFAVFKVIFTTAFNMMKTIIMTVLNFIWGFIKGVWNGIKSVFNTVITAIVNFVKSRWERMKRNVTTVFNIIRNVISAVWNTIKSVTSSVWNGITGTLGGIWNGLKNTVSKAFNWIKDTISGVWDSVKSSTDAIWDGITGSIKGAINGVIGAINGMINALNGLSISLPTIPDWVPGFGGKGGGSISFPNIPKIPSLDVGTNFVAQDGLAMLHAGEAVVPKEYNPALGNEKEKKQPAHLTFVLGGTEYNAFVDDISETQERKSYRLRKG